MREGLLYIDKAIAGHHVFQMLQLLTTSYGLSQEKSNDNKSQTRAIFGYICRAVIHEEGWNQPHVSVRSKVKIHDTIMSSKIFEIKEFLRFTEGTGNCFCYKEAGRPHIFGISQISSSNCPASLKQ